MTASRQPEHACGRAHLGLVEVGDRLDVGCGVAEPREVAEQVLGAVLGAEHERVERLGEVVDHDHAAPRAGVPEPDVRAGHVGPRVGEAVEHRLDRDREQVLVGQADGGRRRLGVVEVHLLGVARRHAHGGDVARRRARGRRAPAPRPSRSRPRARSRAVPRPAALRHLAQRLPPWRRGSARAPPRREGARPGRATRRRRAPRRAPGGRRRPPRRSRRSRR